MSDDVTLCAVLFKKHRDNGVFAGALLVQRWMSLRAKAQTGHTIGSPEVLKPITSPLTPFFWVSKVRDAKVAALSSWSVAFTRSKRRGLTKSCTELKVNGCESLLASVYLPAGRRKKKASRIMSDVQHWMSG